MGFASSTDVMPIILTVFLFSVVLNALLYVPFINLLYRLRLQRQHQQTKDAFERPTPIFDELHQKKAGVPVGGGILIIITTSILFPLLLLLLKYFLVPVTQVYLYQIEILLILLTFIGFGLVGLFDDLKKSFFIRSEKFFGLRLRHKLYLEIFLAVVISVILHYIFKIQILHIPFFGVLDLGWWFIPFAAFTIIAFSNAYNITDGLDGQAAGVLMIALVTFLVISGSILDTPISVFLALWLGGILAFLYFNVFPARIMLGDVGALSFGATLAVIGLLLGKTFALVVIGGIFVVEAFTSLIQLLSKKYLGKKVMVVAPLHLWLQYKGWPEPKVVMRFWLISIFLAAFGLWLALLNR